MIRGRSVYALLVLVGALVPAVSRSAGAGPAGSPCDGQWYVTPTPNPGVNLNELRAVDVAGNGEAWAVGDYAADQRQRPLIVHWDGAAWTRAPYPTTPPGVLNDVESITADDAWIVGTFRGDTPAILHWNGSAWQATPQPILSGELAAVSATGPSDVWAVGTNWQSTEDALVEHWDGTAWSIVPPPTSPDYLTAVEAVGPDDVWVAGEVMNGDTDASAHWNGQSWEVFPLVGFANRRTGVEGLTATPDGSVWAAGWNEPYDPLTPYAAVIERWTGTRWKVATLPPLGAQSLLGDIAWTGDGLWAVGWRQLQGSTRQTLTMRLTPSGWRTEPSPTVGLSPALWGVSGRPGTTLAVGTYATTSALKTLALHRCTT